MNQLGSRLEDVGRGERCDHDHIEVEGKVKMSVEQRLGGPSQRRESSFLHTKAKKAKRGCNDVGMMVFT